MNDQERIIKIEESLRIKFNKTEFQEIHILSNHEDLRCKFNSNGDLIKLKINNISFDISLLLPHLNSFTKIEELSLVGCGIVDINKYLVALNNLEILYLSFNNITSLSKSISKNKKIRILNLSDNNLSSIPFEINELVDLKAMDLSDNEFDEFPNVYGIPNLTYLDLYHSRIIKIPKELLQLESLETLRLSNNQIEILPKWIDKMKTLKSLDLKNNLIKEIPPSLKETEIDFTTDNPEIDGWKNQGIHVNGNPLESPPLEIINRGRIALSEYFKSIEGESEKLKEIKVLIVGEGASGKTSLSRTLRGKEFRTDETTTHGINIDNITLDSVKIRIWDFGGQEIMHSTHQLFLSQRSLYICVLDSRKNNNVEYWLKHIQSFGNESPVIIVINKIDEGGSFNIDENYLKNKYQNIIGFCFTSCKTSEGIDNLIKEIKKGFKRIQNIRSLWGPSWLGVKKEIEDLSKSGEAYISLKKYQSICLKNKVDNPISQEVILQYLNDLGILVYFDDFILSKKQILNPRWITEGIYKIITGEKVIKSKGIIPIKDVFNFFEDDPNYTSEDIEYIILLMQKFELCYSKEDNNVIIPSLLPVVRSTSFKDQDESNRVVFNFNFLPRTIFQRVMVRLYDEINMEFVWRFGFEIWPHSLSAKGLVYVNYEENTISVISKGKDRVDLLSYLRVTIKSVIETFHKIEFEELVPLPNNNTNYIKYKELVGYESMKLSKFPSGELMKEFEVAPILDNLEKRESRIIYNNIQISNITNQNLIIQVQSDFSKLQDLLSIISDGLEKSNPNAKLIEQIKNISSQLDETNPSDESKMRGSLTKLRRFLSNAGDKNSEMNKTIEGAKKIKKELSTVVDYYNKVAPFLGLPGVPKLF